MSDVDVNAPLKPASQTSYAKMFAASAIIGPFLVLALVIIARRFLPTEDADAFIKPLMAGWAIILSGSGITTLIGGLLRTQGKISFQKSVEAAKTVAHDIAPAAKELATTAAVEAVKEQVGSSGLPAEIIDKLDDNLLDTLMDKLQTRARQRKQD